MSITNTYDMKTTTKILGLSYGTSVGTFAGSNWVHPNMAIMLTVSGTTTVQFIQLGFNQSMIVSVNGGAAKTVKVPTDNLYTARTIVDSLDPNLTHRITVSGAQYFKDNAANILLTGPSAPTLQDAIPNLSTNRSEYKLATANNHICVEKSSTGTGAAGMSNVYLAGPGTVLRFDAAITELWVHTYYTDTYQVFADGKDVGGGDDAVGTPYVLGGLSSNWTWRKVPCPALDGQNHIYTLESTNTYIASIAFAGTLNTAGTTLTQLTCDVHLGDSRIAGLGVTDTGGALHNFPAIASRTLGHAFVLFGIASSVMTTSVSSNNAKSVLTNTARSITLGSSDNITMNWAINDWFFNTSDFTTDPSTTATQMFAAFDADVRPLIRTKYGTSAKLICITPFLSDNLTNTQNILTALQTAWGTHVAGLAATDANMYACTSGESWLTPSQAVLHPDTPVCLNPLASGMIKALSGDATDTTAPTFVSANVSQAGTLLTVLLSDAGSPPLLPTTSGAVTGFSLSGSHTLSNGTTNGTRITFTVSPAVGNAETVTLSYSSSTGNVTDLVGNALATFSSQPVTVQSISSLSFSMPTSTIAIGNGVTLTGSVTGTNLLTPNGVTYSATTGTVSGDMYIAPTSIHGTQSTVTVTATSVTDNTQTASTTFTIKGLTPPRLRMGSEGPGNI